MKEILKNLKSIGKTLNVLLIEDDKNLIKEMDKSLHKIFKKEFLANSIDEALQNYVEQPIDIILVYINIQNIEQIQRLNNIKINKDIQPIFIVISDDDNSELLMKLIEEEVDYFILKPIKKEIMLTTLYRAVSKIYRKRQIVQHQKDIISTLQDIEKKNRILETKMAQKSLLASNEDIVLKNSDSQFSIIREQEDADELNDLSLKLDTCVNLLFYIDEIDNDCLIKISTTLSKFGSILNSYPMFSDIAVQLQELGHLLNNSKDIINQHFDDIKLLLETLHYTLEDFRIKVWDNKSVTVTYFNIHIKDSIQTIKKILSHNTQLKLS